MSAFMSQQTTPYAPVVAGDRASQATAPSIPGLTCPVTEEIINQWTHAFGCCLAVIGSVVLLSTVNRSSDIFLQFGCWVYAVSLVLLYLASTLSHSFQQRPKVRERFRTLDQVCIFMLIAGNYTPVAIMCCTGVSSAIPLCLVWLLAFVGSWLKICVTRERMVPLWFYVIMAWAPAMGMWEAFGHLGKDGMFWVLAGAISYCTGVVFFAFDERVRGFHCLWHLLVIGGSACHFMVVYKYTALASMAETLALL